MKKNNKAPMIKISDNQTYEINTSKKARREFYKELKRIKKLQDSGDTSRIIEAVEKVLSILIGENAANEIKEMNLPIESIISILVYIEAAISNKNYKQVNSKYRDDVRGWFR